LYIKYAFIKKACVDKMRLLADFYTFLSKSRVQKILLPVLLIITFVLIYILNRLYPLFAEDWDYRFIWEWEGREPNKINNVCDIIQSQYNHYMLWGGRSIVHAIDQFLLMLDIGWSDVINSMVFVGFVYTIYRITNIGNTRNIFVVIFAVLGVWIAQPAFPTTVLWLTGSANYLWGTLIILLFLYPFCLYYYKQNKSDSILKIIVLFTGGIFAGWTNENTSVAMIFFIIVLLVLMRYEKIPIPKWAISGLTGAVVGCGFLLLAPGNFARLAFISPHEAEIHGTISFLSTLGIRASVLLNHLTDYLLIPSIIYLTLTAIYIRITAKDKRKKTIYLSLLFFVAAMVAHLAMIATPTYPQRALFGIITFILIAILMVYANIGFKANMLKLSNLLVVLLLTGYFALNYYRDYNYLQLVDDFWKEREDFLVEQKSKGEKDIVFEEHFDIYKKNFEFYDLAGFTDNWLNHAYARYHGVNSVRVTTEEEKQK